VLLVIRPNVTGTDLGKREHYVCCPPTPEGKPNVRHFETTTPELYRLAERSVCPLAVRADLTGLFQSSGDMAAFVRLMRTTAWRGYRPHFAP